MGDSLLEKATKEKVSQIKLLVSHLVVEIFTIPTFSGQIKLIFARS